MLNTYLKSELIPAYTVAAFVKRFGRLAVQTNPSGAMICITFIHNLIRRHSACYCLIHKEADTKEVTDWQEFDCYDEGEADPSLSRAIESSLWEVKALGNHWCPQVSAYAEILLKDLTQRLTTSEESLQVPLKASYDALFEQCKNQTTSEFEMKSMMSFSKLDSSVGAFSTLLGIYTGADLLAYKKVFNSAMYSEEGPSSRPLFVRTRSPSVDLEALELSSQEGDNALRETYDVEKGNGDASPQLKSRPLTLFDDYKIVGGVPTFVFTAEDDLRVFHRPFGLSSDGSLMAFATASTTLCVYDLLDGCSLVARKEDVSTERVLFVSFWKDRSDELVVFSLDRTVTFFSIVEKPTSSDDCAASKRSSLKELKEKRSYKPDYDFDVTVDWSLDCFTFESTMWIADLGKIRSKSIHLTRISRGEAQYVELHDPKLESVNYIRIRVGVDVISTEGWTDTMPQQKVNFLYDKIDFRKKKVQADPVDVQGTCIGLNGFGKHTLVWQSEAGGLNCLNLYSNGLSKLNSARPDRCMELGRGVAGVEAIPLNRKTSAFDDKNSFRSWQWPLICVFRIKHSTADVLVWDPDVQRIRTRIKVTIKEVEFTATSKIRLSSSCDGKWLAIIDCSVGVIALFSLFAGVQVWQTQLNMSPNGADRFMPMTFGALSTKLVVNGSNEVYVFNLPCLAKGYDINFKGADRVAAVTNGPCLSEEIVSVIKQERLSAPHNSAFLSVSLLDLFFRKADDEHAFFTSVKVANLLSDSKMAVMIHKESCFSIILASLEEVYSSKYIKLVSSLMKGGIVEHKFHEVKIKEDVAKEFKSLHEIECIVSYPNKRRTGDCIAILGSDGERTNAIFIDLNTNTQELIHFETGMVYVYVQSKDGSMVMCLKEDGIVVIDLKQRLRVHEVGYRVSLLHWIYTFHPERHLLKNSRLLIGLSNREEKIAYYLTQAKFLAPPQIARDGNIVLLGWSVKDQMPILITPATIDQDLEEATGQDNNVMPCWALDETFQKFSFLNFDEYWRSITSIGTHSDKDCPCRTLSKDDWSPQIKRCFEGIDGFSKWTYHMALQENEGCIKITMLLKVFSGYEVTIVPVTPYSMSHCLPCLHSLDSLSDFHGAGEMDKFSSIFGASFFNMHFNGKTNLHIAVEQKDAAMIRSLVSIARRNNVLLGIKLHKTHSTGHANNLLDVAIQQNSEDVVRSFLDVFRKQQVPLFDGAAVISNSFVRLWESNQVVLEELLSDDSLCLEMFTLTVPSQILKNKAYALERVGTCEDLLVRRKKESNDVIAKSWKYSKKRIFETIHKRIGDTEVEAIVKVFCFENLCKVGSDGILRFLVSQQAPAYLFKTLLVKWAILYKWEHIWKARSVSTLVKFGAMLLTFTCYLICIGFYGHRLMNDYVCQACVTFLLIVIMLFVIAMFSEEATQLKTYVKDGTELFPKDTLWGIKHYLRSFWNIIDTCICAKFFCFILPMHFLSFKYTWHFPLFYVGLAIESTLMWLKVWYFAQAFSETGAFVLLIESVARECVPFVILSTSVLIGFSLGLFALFQDVIKTIDTTDQNDAKCHSENETRRRIVSSFENPLEAMLTLFCAMIGAFDVEVYLESGKLSPIIIILFVLYLSMQAVVMFNLLIAVMSDTFDRVKSTEEEQLLMGRARFIDACEAALSEDQIQKMNEDIGKYMYVLCSKGEDTNEESVMWQGRINAIKDNVKKDLRESQAILLEKIEELKKNNQFLQSNSDGENAKTLESLKEDSKKEMNLHMLAMEERIKDDITTTFARLEENIKGEMRAELLAMEERIKADNSMVLEHLKTLTETIQRKE